MYKRARLSHIETIRFILARHNQSNSFLLCPVTIHPVCNTVNPNSNDDTISVTDTHITTVIKPQRIVIIDDETMAVDEAYASSEASLAEDLFVAAKHSFTNSDISLAIITHIKSIIGLIGVALAL